VTFPHTGQDKGGIPRRGGRRPALTVLRADPRVSNDQCFVEPRSKRLCIGCDVVQAITVIPDGHRTRRGWTFVRDSKIDVDPSTQDVVARTLKISSAVAGTPWGRDSPSVVQGMQQRDLGSSAAMDESRSKSPRRPAKR
jgi:hypothetical protein